MSAFDPTSFLDLTVTDSNSTKATPIPAGEYQAVIEKVTPLGWQSKDGLKSGVKLDVSWSINNPAVATVTGREKNLARQDIMLDLAAGGNGLDMGKGMNITLGRLREATGLNEPGAPFSFRMLEGRMAKVKIVHREYNGNLYAEVKEVAKLA